MARPVVFLDACVLYPPLVRRILVDAATTGVFDPRWSPRVLDEWRIASARKQGFDAEARLEESLAEMRRHFPDSSVTPDAATEDGLTLPDAADAHVLAAAIAAGADTLVTFNLRDFPARRLAPHRITPRHPDGFLWELLSRDPASMAGVIRGAAAAVGAHEDETIRRALKRARLPRLAKAWKSHAEAGF